MASKAFATPRSYLVAAGVLAACSLLYELIFAKIVAELTGNATIWESVSMAVFLCGMGLRSLAFRKQEAKELARRLVTTEFSLIACALLSFYLVHCVEALYRIYVYDGGLMRDSWPFPPVFLVGALSQGALFVMGWLTAFELQFFLHWQDAPTFRFRESAVLAAYHFGALAGTILFVACHRLAIDPFKLLCATIALNLFFLCYCLLVFGLSGVFQRTLVTLLSLLLACVSVEPPFMSLVLKNRYYNKFTWGFDAEGLSDVKHPEGPQDFLGTAKELPAVTRLRTPFQVVDLVPDLESGAKAMHINGRFQVAANSAARYHEAFAHFAISSRKRPPTKVLILGGGDGLLAYEVLKHASVEAVDLVELDPDVLMLARTEAALSSLNHGVLDDPRVKVHVTDAMGFVRQGADRYDAAFIDLTYPYDFDSARFFSVEFLRMVQRALVPDGYFVVGSPFDLVEPEPGELLPLVDQTLGAAGFRQHLAYTNGTDHFLLAAKAEFDGVAANTDRIQTSAVRTPQTGSQAALSIMRPRLLMTYDPFY